ncbi:MAG: methyl-accepting chemotaxis protein [Thermodesulfobacteriota bacterium]
MTIRSKLAINAGVVLAAIAVIVVTALSSARMVDQNIGILTKKTTPYQLKALNQQRELQAHSANLVNLSTSANLEDFKKTAALVSVSLTAVSKASDEMAQLKGEGRIEDKTIPEITRGVTDITERKIKAQQEVFTAAKSIQERLSDVAKRLDVFVKSLQQKNSGSMISGVDTLMGGNQHLNNLSLVRNGLKDLNFSLSRISSSNDRRTVVGLKDNVLGTIKNLTTVVKNVKGLDKTVQEINAKLAVLQEKMTATNGIIFLQLRYINDEDPSMGEKIESMIKESEYDLSYLIPTIDKALIAASNTVKNDTLTMAGNMESFGKNNQVLSLASGLSLLSASLVTAINNCIYSKTMNEFKGYASMVESLFQQAWQGGQKLQSSTSKMKSSEEFKLVSSFLSALSSVRNTFSAAGGVSEKIQVSIKNSEELETLNTKMRDITAAHLKESQKEVSQAGANQETVVAFVNHSSKRTIRIISLVGGLIILVTLLMAIFNTRSITRPINQVVAGLLDSSDQVASASAQVSSSSQSLAEGTSEQAAGIEETSSSMEEMSSMTKHNAENADQANSLMIDTFRVVEEANHSMNELNESMKEISQASQETAKIIKTIDEIAFQTNLLALNAAVEAARAGEAGAGFATVADEVRNLALRAADAARNTTDLIEKTVTKIKVGSDVVEKTNSAFSKVSSGARKVGEIVGEIQAASQEQAQGIEQINRAVCEMEKIVQRNAANAEESASASEEMSAQAEHLKGFVGQLASLVGKRVARQQEMALAEIPMKEAGAVGFIEMKKEPLPEY